MRFILIFSAMLGINFSCEPKKRKKVEVDKNALTRKKNLIKLEGTWTRTFPSPDASFQISEQIIIAANNYTKESIVTNASSKVFTFKSSGTISYHKDQVLAESGVTNISVNMTPSSAGIHYTGSPLTVEQIKTLIPKDCLLESQQQQGLQDFTYSISSTCNGFEVFNAQIPNALKYTDESIQYQYPDSSLNTAQFKRES